MSGGLKLSWPMLIASMLLIPALLGFVLPWVSACDEDESWRWTVDGLGSGLAYNYTDVPVVLTRVEFHFSYSLGLVGATSFALTLSAFVALLCMAVGAASQRVGKLGLILLVLAIAVGLAYLLLLVKGVGSFEGQVIYKPLGLLPIPGGYVRLGVSEAWASVEELGVGHGFIVSLACSILALLLSLRGLLTGVKAKIF